MAGRNEKDVFSRLLTNCYLKEETAQQLKEAWLKTDISKERLIEAMMYNQHWIDLVSEVIGWDGLKESACILSLTPQILYPTLPKIRLPFL